MKFRVKLCRDVHEFVYVEVEAGDEDEAYDKMDELDTESLEWQVDDADEADIDEIQEI